MESAKIIVGNQDNSRCPDKCLRPVGITFDKQGRLFFTSDASGEIYVLVNENAATGGNRTVSGSGSGNAGGTSAGTNDTGGSRDGAGPNAAATLKEGQVWIFVMVAAGWVAWYMG